ncbi:TetR/AcrR family transcriptional regulator C-terminal domain-containing protein [Streptomyces sp. NBC_00890]|nr:TetR/AcrR family transcriptional regulator C-terminal domain-containing protein [Streptomyces sp. NBC_00891]WSY09557.1 TetR/AcrR family transcriptional regulator C-terminal domain-containing protein [Streptomyces sp. NBC_00890]WSZ11177.1 TetR/AcrR family transcriptional regulator C-terminal domain-containing protein [Streptomyces sp. NBC_00869]WSZ21317.1 TetR/AcrR family transcriptional regulator C-terminal domain-containing protein [Streptomyces sp. NBC_00870]
MTKMNRETVVAEALDLLDDVGLETVSTRRLAKRLGVEQPSLYYHFKTKKDLLAAMAEAAMAPHAHAALPEPEDDWRSWFLDNSRSFRRTLLMRRDGARLHAGSTPTGDLDRIRRKMAFLVASGVPERQAQMAMLAAGRFTVGCVLEEQAEAGAPKAGGLPDDVPVLDHEAAFEAGLALILGGLEQHMPSRS